MLKGEEYFFSIMLEEPIVKVVAGERAGGVGISGMACCSCLISDP